MHLRICSGVTLGAAAFILVSTVLPGCGGFGSNAVTSTYSAQIAWSARSRDISAPSSAVSAKIEVQGAGGNGAPVTWIANRDGTLAAHTQTYTSATRGPIGSHQVVVTFYASPDAQGASVGTASFTEDIPSGGALTSTVTVGSVVKSVVVASDQVVTAPGTMVLEAFAKDAEGHIVALEGGSFFFSVTGGSEFLKIENGLAKGISKGSATVTARVDGKTSQAVRVTVNASAHFRQIGTLRGGTDGRPEFFGVSGDGTTMVGTAFVNSGGDFGNKPLRWTETGGFQELQIGITTPNTGSALRVSRDGTKIVGYTPGDITIGWIWKDGAVTRIRPLLTSNYTVATDVSDDGKIVAGIVRTFSGERALKWRKNDSYEILFDGADVATSSAIGISSNGAVVVGSRAMTASPDVYHVMVKNGDNPEMEIPFPAGVTSMHASACSSDGTVVVGTATVAGGTSRPFRWSSDSGTTLLERMGQAVTCNADGSIVAGNDELGSFVWTLADGRQSLESYTLKTLGLVLPGQPKNGKLISDNGLILAGGVNPSEEFYEKPWAIIKN